MTKKGGEPVEIKYDKLMRETAGANLYLIGKDEVWIPKSVIEDEDPDEKQFSIPEWMAKDRGLV